MSKHEEKPDFSWVISGYGLLQIMIIKSHSNWKQLFLLVEVQNWSLSDKIYTACYLMWIILSFTTWIKRCLVKLHYFEKWNRWILTLEFRACFLFWLEFWISYDREDIIAWKTRPTYLHRQKLFILIILK